MDSQIEEIKNKLDVIDVVGSYVKLTKTGINYRGVCPFHKEKSPSFFVSPARQMWHCFGCGAGSSIFDFVMKIEGVEFGDALRILANKAGVQLKLENSQLRTQRQKLYEICELACKFFEKQLEGSQAGREAKTYLLKRGILSESIAKWRLGYSPDTWNGLTDFLIGKGHQREEVVKAGLAIQKERNAHDSYDRFRGRIMFPVFDLNSQVVGFGGRVFKEADKKEVAKYINTPQTLLYDKSGVIYGLNRAKLAVRKQNQCVVTEGYTDVIMCHQAGFDNTIAASGTALTSQHLNILKRYSENLVLAFDMDVAGDSATKRGISLAQEQGFNIKVIESYLKDADPADIILKNVKQWEESVANARSIMDYYFDSAFANFDKDVPEGKKEISKTVLPMIKRIQNRIEQSYWIQKLAEMLQVKEEAIAQELEKITVGGRGGQTLEHDEGVMLSPIRQLDGHQEANPEHRKKIIEERIISLIFQNAGYAQTINESHLSLFSAAMRKLLEMIKSFLAGIGYLGEEEKNAQSQKFFGRIIAGNIKPDGIEPDDAFKEFLSRLALVDLGQSQQASRRDDEQEFSLCLLYLKNIELRNALHAISQQIKQAESAGDYQKAKVLMDEFNALSKQLS